MAGPVDVCHRQLHHHLSSCLFSFPESRLADLSCISLVLSLHLLRWYRRLRGYAVNHLIAYQPLLLLCDFCGRLFQVTKPSDTSTPRKRGWRDVWFLTGGLFRANKGPRQTTMSTAVPSSPLSGQGVALMQDSVLTMDSLGLLVLPLRIVLLC